MRQEPKYLAVRCLHEENGYPIAALCNILKLNRSSYYKWLKRDQSKQEASDKALIELICKLYQESDGVLGYRRIRRNMLRDHGMHVNKKRVHRIMRVIGLKSVIRRKRTSYIKTTPEVMAENVLDRQFTAEKLNEKWLTDVTEFKVGGVKLYLSAILDLKDKSIVAYEIGRHNDSPLVFKTFDAAVQKYPDAKPIFHSDRGSQYTTKVFRAKLDAQGMTQSMSRPGRCIDNGPMEAFWGTLKVEMYYLRSFSDCVGLKQAIEEYIAYYNNRRYQEKLGGLAPLELRELLLAA